MEIFLILNFYFIISLILCDILKKNYFLFKSYSILDIYLYLVLYALVLLIIFSAFNFTDEFHATIITLILFFFCLNLKKLKKINFKTFFKSLLILNVILIICIDKEFIWWDEFSSWGLRTKEILIHNSIFYDNFVTNLKKPSGSSLLHYIFIKYLGFNESIIIFSQFTITILLLNNILYDFKIKRYPLIDIIIFFLLIHFISFTFNYGLFSIYTGVITSVLFLKIISILFIKNNNDLNNKIFELFPVVFLIIFLKDFSLFYVVYIFFILIISFLITKEKIPNLINFILFFITTICTLLLQKFISLKLKIETNISNYNIYELLEIFLSMKVDFNQINNINIFQGSIFRIPNQIIEKIFLKSEFFYEIDTNLIFWFVFFSILNLILFFYDKEKYIKKISLFLSLYLISIFHLLLILISYNIFFGGPEALVKASFGRYMGLYFMPYSMFLIFYIISNSYNTSKLNIFLLVVFMSIAPAKSIEILIPSKLNSFNTNMKEIINNKNNIKDLSELVNQKYKSEKTYILINNDDGFILNMFKIYFYPNMVNNDCWSFKKNKKKTTFMFNCNYQTNNEIIKRLNGYELIINYKKNNNYDKILTNNNYKIVEDINNAFVYKKN